MRVKKGFTLAEVLIAVGIIGIIAALMAHAFNNATPDKTKMLFLKAYDGLSEAVIAMGEDPSLFARRITIQNNNVNIENHPFLDGNAPSNPYFQSSNSAYYSDSLKFARILATALKANDIETASDSSYIEFTSGPGKYKWKVTPLGDLRNLTLDTTNDTLSGFANEIELTIGENDTFKMCVQANGKIEILDDSPGVNRGLTYLNNRHNVKSLHDTGITNGVESCEADPIVVRINGVTMRTLP